MPTTSNIIQTIYQRLINVNQLKVEFIICGKTLNKLDQTSIEKLQIEYQLAANTYLPTTHHSALPILFYINEDNFEQHLVDLYESSQNIFNAVIPVIPNILTIILIGQVAKTISLGQQYLITEQIESNGKIEALTIDKDYYLDLAKFDSNSQLYTLESGAMLIVANPSNQHGDFLLSFSFSN